MTCANWHRRVRQYARKRAASIAPLFFLLLMVPYTWADSLDDYIRREMHDKLYAPSVDRSVAFDAALSGGSGRPTNSQMTHQ